MADLETATPAGFDLKVYCIPAGQVIGRRKDGSDIIMTDKTVVEIGNEFFCTQPIFDQIQERSRRRMS